MELKFRKKQRHLLPTEDVAVPSALTFLIKRISGNENKKINVLTVFIGQYFAFFPQKCL